LDEQQYSETTSLAGLPEDKRARALARFQAIRPFLEEGIPVAVVAEQQRIPVRTAWRWIEHYRKHGLIGLSRKERKDKDQRKLSLALQHVVEGLALRKPRLSAAAIHRMAIQAAQTLGERPPSYSSVYALIRCMAPALLTMALDGTKAYTDSFDLVHRGEAEAPNAIWQADHTELDILVKDEKGVARKPWLTIVLDDYSRAVAGYLLAFSAPSAIQTALALRQAIWRKPQAGWHVCGIPQVLYTDHGSDFRQIDFSRPVETQPIIQTMLPVFICPSDGPPFSAFGVTDATHTTVCQAAPSSYAATVGNDPCEVDGPTGNGIFYRNSRVRMVDIKDGTSQTTMVGDRAWNQAMGIWAGAPNGAVTRPGPQNVWPTALGAAQALILVHNNWINITTDADGGLDDFSSNHTDGINLLFADGSVHFLHSIIADGQERHDFWALGTRAGGELILRLQY
jgi:prepilin-type processing-associated H-X9-DG protein